MDAIDITSAEFSLGNVQEAVSSTVEVFKLDDYIIYIYIVLGIIAFVIAFLIYKYYSSKSKRVTFQDKIDDCYGENRS
jgi:hypothetical protein